MRKARAAGHDDPAQVLVIPLSGVVHIAAARRITLEDAPGAIPGDQSSVLLFARHFTPSLLQRLSGDNTLPYLRVSNKNDADSGEMALPISGVDPAEPAGYLIWRPNLPGTQLIRVMAMPLLVLVALKVFLLALILRRARRAGAALDTAAAAMRNSRDSLEVKVRQRTAELAEAEGRYRGIVENAVEGIFQITPGGQFIGANPAMARILGFVSPDEVLAKANADTILDAHSREAFGRVIGTFGEVIDFVSEVRRPDGTKTWISQNTREVKHPDGNTAYYEGMVVDITARRQAEEDLIRSALNDPLTGLPNRFFFFERLSHLVARSKRGSGSAFALLYIDCDRFKLINDSFGHLAGDDLLIALSQRLVERVGGADTLARLGGDEFAILVEGDDMPAIALDLAERVHGACAEPMEIGDREVFVRLSIGIAVARGGNYAAADEVLRDADIAMYQAKDKGRSTTVLCEPGMHQSVVSRLAVETELRHALERGEFVVYYQPIIGLKDQRIAGFEALVRWSHPTRGLVAPSEFIPTAEETGMIVPIGDWVLRESCTFASTWRRRYGAAAQELFMSVNVSAVQLSADGAVQRIARILEQTGLPGSNLKLEVTELAMMTNPLDVLRTLSSIAALGVHLCVDDFGTGYSSLSHLHTFPFDSLKIDRSFIGRLTVGREHVEMVRTILLLGETLKLAIVAEGIETELQRDWLRAAGCPYGQGYLFARPVDYKTAFGMLDADCAGEAVTG